MRTKPHEIAAYFLKNLPHVHDVRPCSLTIKGTVYPAVHYCETLDTPAGTPAYARGERSYTREMIYVVGMLPAAKRRGNVAFTLPGDGRDWFVAGYYGAVVARQQAVMPPSEHHPFGNSFLLAPWDTEGSVDQYATAPYPRVAVSIEYWTE